MKLIRVKILGENFRSLTANVDYEFNDTFENKKLSTKVFAGLNGSGKSNFLELLAEIFYYLERSKLKNSKKSFIENKNFGFEIEYILPKSKRDFFVVQRTDLNKEILVRDRLFEKDVHVKIKKNLEGFLEMSYSLVGEDDFVVVEEFFSNFLPSKIIAYTSGQNEILSNPFIRLRYHNFGEMLNYESNSLSSRLYFLDQENSYSIFVANMLLGQTQPLNYIKNLFSIKDIHSFRLTFNYRLGTKEAKNIFEKKIELLEPLKSCATSWKDDKKKKSIVLDFLVNQATHEAFRFYYENAFKLFQTFYDLHSLNLLLEKQTVRKFVVNASKTINVTEEISKTDPSNLVFRIEKIRVRKQKLDDDKEEILYYRSLSDGEHQLNEVIGSVMMMENDACLFLMDEPDTHFNPKWRAKMVTMLNKVSEYHNETANCDDIRKHELLITTHSPFIISDIQKDNVYKFIREKNSLRLENPKHETYGTSITFLMKQIFGRDITISDYANSELIDLKKEIQKVNNDKLISGKIDEIEERLVDFGESIEKFDLYNYISQIKKS